MKKLKALTIFIIGISLMILATVFGPSITSAVTFWYLDGTTLKPVDASWTAEITATPAGLDSQIQYNNSGSLGGSSNFVWDDTNDRLGIGTSTPTSRLSIHALTSDNNTGQDLFSVASSTASATTTLFYIDNQGHARFSDGTSGAPSISFVDDTDTGWYRPANGSVTLVSEGNIRLRWVDSAGLYLGNSSNFPAILLSDGQTLANIVPSNGDTDTGVGYGGTNKLALYAGGKQAFLTTTGLGIGTTSPYARLSVHGLTSASDVSLPLFSVASSTASATTTFFEIDNQGNIDASNANSFSAPSGFGGRSLTVNGTALDADAELYTFDRSPYISASSTDDGISTTTEDSAVSFYVKDASTITQFTCFAEEAGTSTIKATHTTNPLSAGTNILYTTGATCGAEEALATTTFSDATIPAGSWIKIWVSDAEPTGSRPKIIPTNFSFTKDD